MVEAEAVEAQVLALLQPLAVTADAVVESVRLVQRGEESVLEVTVDRAEGTASLPLDDVAELSRSFSEALDTADPLTGAYTLEVGTPGAESELKALRHYQRNLGRTIRVKTVDGEKLEGQLTAVGEDSFTLRLPDGEREITFDEVRKARPRVTFG